MSTPQITVLDLRAMAWLLLGLGLTVLPHMFHLPAWISIVVLGIGAWRWLAAKRNWHLPKSSLKFLLTFALMIAIFIQFGTLVGRESGTALLVIMMGLKLVELRQRRDVLFLMFLAYFTLVTHFLYNQSIPIAAYVLVVAWLLLSLHMHLSSLEQRPIRHSLRTAGGLALLGMPMMLALFILFPRIDGPIWGLPKDAHAGMTGLSDSMSPGAISQLSESDAVAFRVEFENAAPPPEKRYWRGPVLWSTDGRNWTAGPQLKSLDWRPPKLTRQDVPVSYTVTLEPHNRNWLFVLDLPATSSEHGRISHDFQLNSRKKVRQRMRYSMASLTEYNTGPLPDLERRLGLSLPPNMNPRTVALGRALRRNARSDSETVQQALKMFNEQPFVYSLRPPLLDNEHPSDQFLFETRTGFCEHFASSFTLMMRAAGIPARVVTGYQGGELNPVDDYYIVRQRDAHAWSEVWLNGQGWVRIDPTAAVAPERIERSIDTSLLDTGAAVRFKLPQSDLLTRAWQQLNLNLDAINNRWNQWILGYGPKQQRKFLENLGIDISDWRKVAWIFMVIVGGLLLFVTLFVLRPQHKSVDPVLKTYQRFCHKLAKRGLTRNDNETAGDFAKRIKHKRPELSQQVDHITTLYSQLRYANSGSEKLLLRFKQQVVEFKP